MKKAIRLILAVVIAIVILLLQIQMLADPELFMGYSPEESIASLLGTLAGMGIVWFIYFKAFYRKGDIAHLKKSLSIKISTKGIKDLWKKYSGEILVVLGVYLIATGGIEISKPCVRSFRCGTNGETSLIIGVVLLTIGVLIFRRKGKG